MYLCERWVWACMWLHRMRCTRACGCTRRRCGRRHHVRAWVRPPGYIANAHVMYNIYVYIHRCQVRVCELGTRVCSCVCVRSRSGADDARISGMCASAARSLRKAIHRWNTHIHSICVHNACMCLHPCAASCPDERIADAGPPHTRAHVLRLCARVCACAIGRPRIRADTCARLPSAWTAGGLGAQAFSEASAFNANIGAWNTARVTDFGYVCAAFPARAARHRGRDALGRVVGAARAVVRGGTADARAHVCADVWARACAGVPVCRYSCA